MIHRSFGYIYLHNQDWVLNALEIVIKNTGSKITSSSNTIISLSLLIMLLRCSWKMFLASRCIWWYNADFSNVTFSMYRSMFCYDNVLPIFFHNDSLERKLWKWLVVSFRSNITYQNVWRRYWWHHLLLSIFWSNIQNYIFVAVSKRNCESLCTQIMRKKWQQGGGKSPAPVLLYIQRVKYTKM